MFIKPSKKWRNPDGDQSIMAPYTYYRLCESYREAVLPFRQKLSRYWLIESLYNIRSWMNRPRKIAFRFAL